MERDEHGRLVVYASEEVKSKKTHDGLPHGYKRKDLIPEEDGFESCIDWGRSRRLEHQMDFS